MSSLAFWKPVGSGMAISAPCGRSRGFRWRARPALISGLGPPSDGQAAANAKCRTAFPVGSFIVIVTVGRSLGFSAVKSQRSSSSSSVIPRPSTTFG